MIGVMINSAVTYGLLKLFGNKQTKYIHHVLFWVGIWLVSFAISLS